MIILVLDVSVLIFLNSLYCQREGNGFLNFFFAKCMKVTFVSEIIVEVALL